MNVVLLGDSNLSTGGDDCTGERSWSKWFKELFQPKTCVSYARSGATWTNNALTKHDTKENIARVGNSNVIYNQVNRFDEAYKNGVDMVFKSFNEALERMNVKKIDALNAPFDPNFHNAVMHVEGDEYPENTVVEVFQEGYVMGERVIRPAMVKVAN